MPDDAIHTLLQALQSLSLKLFPGSDARKKALLGELSLERKFSARQLLQYHDLLLGMLAFPENAELNRLARAEITRMADMAGKGLQRESWQQALAGSGIRGSAITGSFSYDLCRWLDDRFPGQAEIESSETDPETLRLFFRALLPRMEYESISAGECDLAARIRLLRGKTNGNSLHWLLQQLDASGLEGPVKEALFNSLRLYIRWTSSDPVYNRSVLHDGLSTTGYYQPLKRPPASAQLLARPLPEPTPTKPEQREHLADLARCTLAWLYRETEPFTYTDHREVFYYRLENGLSVALFGMRPERRLSLESYIGYLALRNGIPIAYGGGWLFGDRCQFGINILPPFRGGDSIGLLYQLLRVYHQRFGAKRFVIKPYQFGLHNSEALRSGAFWFYYKAGFRPASAPLLRLAEAEASRKAGTPGYRSPISVLKKFTASDLVFETDHRAFPKQDAAVISRCLTDFINAQYGGDRQCALSESVVALRRIWRKDWPSWRGEYENRTLAEWSLLTLALLRPAAWSPAERRQLIRLVGLKLNGRETEYTEALRACKAFWRDTRELLC